MTIALAFYFDFLRPNGRLKHSAKDEARASVKRATLMAGDRTHGQSGDRTNWPRAAPPPPSALPTPHRAAKWTPGPPPRCLRQRRCKIQLKQKHTTEMATCHRRHNRITNTQGHSNSKRTLRLGKHSEVVVRALADSHLRCKTAPPNQRVDRRF